MLTITNDMIDRVSNTLSIALNDELSRYIALGYSVRSLKGLEKLLDYKLLCGYDNIDIPFIYYNNIITETGFDRYYNEQLININSYQKPLEKFFLINNKKEEIVFDSILEIPVDIGLHFNLYLSYYVNLLDGQNGKMLECFLIGFKFYLKEINKKKVDDGEIYIEIEYYDLNSEDMGIYVISDRFEMLSNYLFIDFIFNKNQNHLCFCSSGKELL